MLTKLIIQPQIKHAQIISSFIQAFDVLYKPVNKDLAVFEFGASPCF